MRVAIVGQGYVGTELGLAANRAGHTVFGIDVNESRIAALKDVGYPTSTDYSAISEAEIVVITVPTPLNENREPDLSYIELACERMAPHLKAGTLIVNESTSYPGTLRELIAKSLGDKYLFASAPERVDPGNKVWTIEKTPRLLGALSETALKMALEFYKSIAEKVVVVSSPEVAEAAKLFENTFRQVNIALVNEFAQIAEGLGIPTFETLEAANTKPYGFMKFLPGLGVGGHCIPIDPSYLSFKASQVGVEANFINLANQVNLNMPRYLVERLDNEHKLSGKSIQIAGIAYKPNVSDTRESPALSLIELLKQKGAKVTWHDEIVKEYSGQKSDPLTAVDLGIICVAHDGANYQPWIQGKAKVIDVSPGPNIGFEKYL
jgi:UDP-N-acetyl-D-glucosamine dehydrogenase